MKVCDGKFGYNVKLILEMGEEIGLFGLNEVCCQYVVCLKVDFFIVFDGLCVNVLMLIMFLGLCGGCNFDLICYLCDGGYYLGNWGGLLCNFGVCLVNVIVCLVDECGVICVLVLLFDVLLQSVCKVLVSVKLGGGFIDFEIDLDWGEFDFMFVECVFGWNMLEVLVFKIGNLEVFVNVILGCVMVYCQICFVVGSDDVYFIEYICVYFDEYGYDDVQVMFLGVQFFVIWFDLDDEWVCWGLVLLQESIGKILILLFNLGGLLFNDVFFEILGLFMLWVLYFYLVCLQYVFNEYILVSVLCELLQLMVGLFWDLVEQGCDVLVCCLFFMEK